MAYEGPSSGVINIIPRTSSGSGVYVPVTPSGDIGGDGDFAFDQNTNTLYGPKDSTQTNPWPVSGLSIGNGRYTWRAAWSSSNSYNAGDIVHYNAEQFVCIKTLDYGSPVAWTAQAYTAGSYVTYSSVLYVAVVDAVSGDVPGTATSVWKQATPDIDSANYGFAAQGNFLRLSSSIQAETTLSSSSGTMRLAVAKNSLLYGAYPIAPQGIQTGSTFPNYIVDSQAVDASSSLELSTTSFLTPAWNSGGGGATVEVKASGVTTAKIADRAVTNIKLANTSGSEAVSTGVIRDSAVTTAKLADSSVTSAKIVNGTIATADIADGAITQPLLSVAAVGETNISPYLTTATASPSAYFPATKIVSAGTTASGQAISTTNKAVDIASVWYENSVGLTSPLLASTIVALTNNRVYLNRVTPSTGRTISHLAFTLASTVATSNDSCDLGIYALNANGTTIDLVASTGATSSRLNAAAFSVQTVALSSSYAMTAGTTYYLAFVSALGGTAAQLPAIASAHLTINQAMKPTTANSTVTQSSLVAFFSHSAATLPTSITMASCGATASIVSLVARTQA